MQNENLTVAHLVNPYLFNTGSWIHAQLVHAKQNRPIVITRRLDHQERFPFEPVYNIYHNASVLRKLQSQAYYYLGELSTHLYRGILEKEKPAVLHAHLGWEGARAATMAKKAGIPLITTFYGRDAGLLPRFPWWRIWYKRLFKLGSGFTVEGPHLGQMLENLGCPKDKIHILHLGIDLERIPLRHKPLLENVKNRPVEIVVSSSLRPKKGVVSAVKAFAYIANQYPKAHLRILGDGPEKGHVLHQIHKRGLTERITLEGYVSYERHLEVMQQADLFLAPSRTAPNGDTEGGAPVALIEAQAACVPVVSTMHADIPEIVSHGTSGLLSPEADDEALARNLLWMMDNPEMWILMGRAGRSRMEKEFNIHIQMERLSKIYRSV